MITANELRVGNWVIGAETSKHIKLTSVGIYMCEYKKVNYIPIPLTPEILEKAGFVHFTQGWYEKMFCDNMVTVNLGLEKLCIDDEYKADDQVSMPLIAKHVHQLQNLYYALTGSELQIIL